MIELKDRILLNDGTSVLNIEQACLKLLTEGTLNDNIKVFSNDSVEKFQQFYDIDITAKIVEEKILPKINKATDDELLNLSVALETPRDDTPVRAHTDRLNKELQFFINNDKIDLLCSLVRLIEKFKQNNIVWGVGRGSSCASYILFLLKIHDINPIKYDIDFSEFSKEKI